MRDDCIKAVSQAAGRSLTQAEIKDIENRIARNQRQLAQTDRQAYLSMSPAQRLQAAAQKAADELKAEAIKKKQRIALTIQKHDAIQNYMARQKKTHNMGGMEALSRVIAFKADRKSDFQSAETRSKAVANDYIRQLVDSFESVGPKMFGLFSNKEGVRALTYELFGQDSSAIVKPDIAATAKKAAKIWNDTAEAARQAFNNAGGQIGKLTDWRMPQSHSQPLVAKAGRDAWVAEIFGKLDRKRYVKEDGSMMTDPELTTFLQNAWETIATGGANKMEPGKQMGKGMLANRNAEERSIHFKDAESYLDYQEKFGGRDAYTAMMSHITGLGDDIGMVETFGPNPDLAFRYWLETAVKEEKKANPTGIGKIDAKADDLKNLYEFVAGKSKPVANYRIAQGFDTLRNWMVATRLGSAFITSITDNATMQIGAAINNMPHSQLLRNQLSTLNPLNKDELRIARRAGLSLQTMIGEMNRWGAESMLPSFSSKMASLTIRLSGLNAATEARRRAFGVTMYGSVGDTVKTQKDFASLDVHDKRLLESKGIDQKVYDIWRKASLENWGNGNDNVLTPESIYKIPDTALAGMGDPATIRRDAALKLLGMVDEEVNMAVIEPGARERSALKMGLQRGTWKGEIMRSFFLFKSFPFAMISRHMTRGLNMPTAGGKAYYVAGLIAATTVLGAAAQQISQVIGGKDPKDMTKGKFWVGALLKGGSLGIYGDFLFDTNTQYGSSPLATLSGPVAGAVEEMIGLSHGNLMKYLKGENTHAGAEFVKFLKSNTPLQNLWYTKAATDRLIFNQLQEMVSPGYLARVEARARKDFQQSFYWPPNKLTPQRLPNMGAAIGANN